MLVSAFPARGLILASLGTYGVISYSVARQTQEMGVRMAPDATAGKVQWTVIQNTLRLAAAGILLGTVAAFLVSRAIAEQLKRVARCQWLVCCPVFGWTM